jgi:hypothetical protein
VKKLLYIIVLLPFITNAQTVSGIVKSQATNLPIEDTNIYLLRTHIGTLTNKKGEFSLNNKINPNDTLQVSHIGYITTKIAITDLKKSNYVISLEEDVETLKNVTVTDNRWSKLKSKLNFTKLSPLEYGIYSFGSVVANGKIYVVGGDASEDSNAMLAIKSKNIDSSDPRFLQKYMDELKNQGSKSFYKQNLFVYDTKTDIWHKSNVKFKKRAYHNANFYNNTLYVLGGKNFSTNKKIEYLDNEIEVFDISKNTITIDKTNPHKAADFASFVYKDNIIVMGGSIKSNEKNKKTFTDQVHMYNITSGLWYELAKMPEAKEVKGVLINDKIFIVGNKDSKNPSVIQSFDLTNESWKNETALSSRLENPGITSNNNTIYLFENGKLLVYNINSKQVKEYLISLELDAASMHFLNDKLYIIGGFTDTNYTFTPSKEVYTISIDEFENTKPNLVRDSSQNNIAHRN